MNSRTMNHELSNMILAIDIGNTRIKLALFKNEKLFQKVIWDSWSVAKIEEFAYNHLVKKIILSSVKTVPEDILNFLTQNFDFLQLTAETPLPIYNKYQTPKTLGKDRLAAVVGAYRFFPKQNCLVIDAGTCITYDLLTAEKNYLGGNIAPGIGLRMRAMHEFTAKLPLIERGEQDQIWGISTETALRNGGQYGAAYEMQGFIDACEAEFGRMQVILTGGDADFFGKALKTKIFVRPNLVLWGLLEILNYNRMGD